MSLVPLQTPQAEQKKIVLFGLRNSGKSSLFNNIVNRELSIVSAQAGTTTDPVHKSMELGNLGAITLTDTAGLDDQGELGLARVEQSLKHLNLADIFVLVTPAHQEMHELENKYLEKLQAENKPVLVALSFADLAPSSSKRERLKAFPLVEIDNLKKTGISELRTRLIQKAQTLVQEMTPVEGLVSENDLVVFVTPIDLAAPKGRLILPQVETIRDLLDRDCATLVVKEREFKFFYEQLKIKPKLVITDSQVFHKVAADLPSEQALTSFSILFARKKGDLAYFVQCLKLLKNVPAGSKIIVLEACTHHQQADDIGTVKIPRLFKQLFQSQVEFEFLHKIPSPEKLKEYYLLIACGACMVTRNHMQNTILACQEAGVGMLNYGLFIAYANGLIPRVLEPFPLEHELYMKEITNS